MNMKTWLPLACAIVLGTFAAFVAKGVLSRSHAAAAPKAVQVVVAKAAVSPGEELTADQLTVAIYTNKPAPANSFNNISEVVGRVLTAPLLTGQPVLQESLAPRGSATGVQALIPAGMRAVTIEVSQSGGLGGLLAPGAHVDVLLTTLAQDPDKTLARTVVQNVQVLAVGQRMGPGKAESDREAASVRNVTLLTTPHDAEALELASSVRPLRLALRSAGDVGDSDTDGVQLSELRGGASDFVPQTLITPQPVVPQPTTMPVAVAPPTTQPEPSKHWTMRIIRGTEERRVVFTVDPTPAKEQVGDSEPQTEAVPH